MNAMTLRLDDDDGYICTNESDNVRRPMTMTDYAQSFCIAHEIGSFANFVEQHLVLHEYASIRLVIIEASM